MLPACGLHSYVPALSPLVGPIRGPGEHTGLFPRDVHPGGRGRVWPAALQLTAQGSPHPSAVMLVRVLDRSPAAHRRPPPPTSCPRGDCDAQYTDLWPCGCPCAGGRGRLESGCPISTGAEAEGPRRSLLLSGRVALVRGTNHRSPCSRPPRWGNV